MTYKIRLKGSGNIEIIEESKVSRPISAYAAAQVEPNVVYAVVDRSPTQNMGEGLKIKLFDMITRSQIRALSLVITIAGRYQESFHPWALLKIDTSLGSLKNKYNHLDKNGPENCEAGNPLMSMIWSKGVPCLLNILTLLEEKFSEEKFVKHEAWLKNLQKDKVYFFKKTIAQQLGKPDAIK